jgi:hypothetical protein
MDGASPDHQITSTWQFLKLSARASFEIPEIETKGEG